MRHRTVKKGLTWPYLSQISGEPHSFKLRTASPSEELVQKFRLLSGSVVWGFRKSILLLLKLSVLNVMRA